MYRLKSTHLQSLKYDKIYLLEIQISNYIKLRLKYLPKVNEIYKKVVKKDIIVIKDKTAVILNNVSVNKVVKSFFKQT